jgi:hypothetical protein
MIGLDYKKTTRQGRGKNMAVDVELVFANIQWKDDEEKQNHKAFGVIPSGMTASACGELEIDDAVFYWLTADEVKTFGVGFDGGDWVVISMSEEQYRA